jgi:hypothetical protein
MGIRFGKNAGNRPGGFVKQLAEKIERKGGRDSTGAAHLLSFMAGKIDADERTLCAEEAEQAARSLRRVAGRLRGDDRRIAEKIAEDADAAARSGRSWTIG